MERTEQNAPASRAAGVVGHTPLPWFAVDRGRKGEPMMSVMAERIRGRGPSHEVAICATGDSPQGMESANAELICRAVNSHADLLAALEGLVAEYDGNAVPSDDLDELYNAARAALSKARGLQEKQR